jgi:diguanylate cyclase (GGDEF)-like protein
MTTTNLPDRDLEIERAQLRGFVRSISEVEWLLLILVVLHLFVTRPDLAEALPVIGVLVGFALFVLAFRYGKLLARLPRAKIVVEILAMLAFLTAVLARAGGVESPLLNLYLLPIIAAALALGKRATTLVLLLVCACYALLALVSTDSSGLVGLVTPARAVEAVSVLAPFVLVAFCTTLLAENILVSKQRIRALSDRDELTGLYNLRAFMRFAESEHARAGRMERPYSLLMLDVDQLKDVNDTYGHEAGNRAVALVADALQRLVRSSDIVARYGGDEFIALLVDANRTIAEEVAQRVRNVISSTTLEVDVKMVRLKAGVGIATYPEDAITLSSLMTCVDRSMYKDKHDREPAKGRIVFKRR